MNNVDTTVEREAKTETVELLDCGEASKVTKGSLIGLVLELSWPPFNWQFPS